MTPFESEQLDHALNLFDATITSALDSSYERMLTTGRSFDDLEAVRAAQLAEVAAARDTFIAVTLPDILQQLWSME